MDARLQLYDLKTKYTFQAVPGVCDYNMPLYSVQNQPGSQPIAPFPVYQGFFDPCYVDGIQIPFYNQRDPFWKIWPNYVQELQPVAYGDGSTTTFSLSLPFFPAIPGSFDITGAISLYNSGATGSPLVSPYFDDTLQTSSNFWVVPTANVYPGVTITYTSANGSNVTVIDTGQFLNSSSNQDLYGLLVLNTGSYPNGLQSLGTYSTTSNTVNYNTGQVHVTFPTPPPDGASIQAQCYFYEQGIPRAILYYNNCITIRPPPNTQYSLELNCYLTPAAFLSTSQAIPFGYMAEYIARGAARKILSDTGDWEQFNVYEPLFIEQERNVWKRSQRIFTSRRTGTIFSDLEGPQSSLTNLGQGAT